MADRVFGIIIIGLFLMNCSAETRLEVPQVVKDRSLSHADRPDAPAVWCGIKGQDASARLNLKLKLPGRPGQVELPVAMVRCSDESAALSDPSGCVSGDSLKPREWVNVCATLLDSREAKATLEVQLSWQVAGGRGDCVETVEVPLDHDFTKQLPCGVAIEGAIQSGGERSNFALEPTAITRPRLNAHRWADL
jgi:hypothetical protein